MNIESRQLPEVTTEYCESLWQRVCNWGRWGAEDQAGALNLITPEKRLAAVRLVQDGACIGLGNPWPVGPSPDNPWPAQHFVMRAGDAGPYPGHPDLNVALDYLGVACHGVAVSHVDALCHVFVDGHMYNGHPASDVRSTGALHNDVMPMADGVVTRGVVLDLAAVFGTPYLPGEARIGVAHLEAAERAQNLEVGSGDAVIIHLGREARVRAEGMVDSSRGLAGLHPECAAWLHERGAAILGSDGMNDPQPNWTAAGWPLPIHYLGICGMGMTLMHNLETERLVAACRDRERYQWLFAMAPLKVPGATGSPANPLAMF